MLEKVLNFVCVFLEAIFLKTLAPIHYEPNRCWRPHKQERWTSRISCQTGIAVYKATRLKFDNEGQLVSFYGVGKTGKLTKVYINH